MADSINIECLQPENLKQVASKVDFLPRNTAHFTPHEFLSALLAGCVGEEESSLETIVTVGNLHINRQTMFWHLSRKETVSFLKNVLSDLLAENLKSEACNFQDLSFSTIKIIDSTVITLPEEMNADFKASGGSASGAGCKVQFMYNYTTNQVELIDVTSGILPDQSYVKSLSLLIKNGDLVLFDRGYSTVSGIQQVVEAGAFFVSMLKSNITITDASDGSKIDIEQLLTQLDKDKIKNKDILVYLGPNNDVLVRLILNKFPKDVAKAVRKRTVEDARKKRQQISARKLKCCEWSMLITNIPESMYDFNVIAKIYPLRWQVEIIFKELKSALKIDVVRTKNTNRFLCELYTKFIWFLIGQKGLAKYRQTIWDNFHLEISGLKFYRRFGRYVSDFAQALKRSTREALHTLNGILSCILPHSFKCRQRSRLSTLEAITEALTG